MIHFTKVYSKQQIADVSILAQEIWQEHYLHIIGQDQIDYMLKKFQSVQAIKTQLSDGYEYYSIFYYECHIGYISFISNMDDASLMISKLYVKKLNRGSGIGEQMLRFSEALCLQRKIKKIWLTVNKYNKDSIAWYLKMGFTNKGPIVQDIGGGFAMDDLLMEKYIRS